MLRRLLHTRLLGTTLGLWAALAAAGVLAILAGVLVIEPDARLGAAALLAIGGVLILLAGLALRHKN